MYKMNAQSLKNLTLNLKEPIIHVNQTETQLTNELQKR